MKTVAGDGDTEWGRKWDAGGAPWYEGNFFDRIGGPARRASIGPVTSVAVADDGSWLIRSGTDDSKVYVVPGTRSTYFGVAFRALRPALGYLTYAANRGSRVTLTLAPRGGPTVTVEQQAHRGLNRLRIPGGVRPGVYYLRLVASARGGYASADEVGMVMGRRLPDGLARIAIDDELDRGDYENTSGVSFCERMSPMRVDCEVGDIDTVECEGIRAVRLQAGGQLEEVGYPCGRWRRAVPWRRSTRMPLFGALWSRIGQLSGR
jgi:hypothetical protein